MEGRDRKDCTRGGAAARHCRPDAMKHVLPKFLRPHTPGHAAESMAQITSHKGKEHPLKTAAHACISNCEDTLLKVNKILIETRVLFEVCT
jgi:hypothetical protein